MKRLMWLVPALYFRHRGYFLVVCAIAVVHLFAACDELLPQTDSRHASPGWTLHNQVMSHLAWGLTHGIAGVITVVGLYVGNRNMLLIRMVSASSASIFLLMLITSAINAATLWPHVSLIGMGLYFFVVLSSVASLFEPSVNPANARTTP